jgi:hypothetical protein
VARNLRDRTGTAEIHVELVERIERTRAGKFPAIVCHLPKRGSTAAVALDTRGHAA